MHEQVLFSNQSTINVKWTSFPEIQYPLHFHSEHEIVFVHRSHGTRVVADSAEKFEDGDLVLVGSQTPHFWNFDEKFKSADRPYFPKVTVIHFPNHFFKGQCEEYAEFSAIHRLLKQAHRGLHFSRSTALALEQQTIQLHHKSGLELIIALLQILQTLAKSNDYRLLSSEGYAPDFQDFQEERLRKVIKYLKYNYRNKVSLEEVADVASLHPTAFCRFFKEKTSRTLMEFIIEMRIGHACKLLTNSSKSVSQICYECGFNNLANFNRKFKQITNHTPSQYQQQYLV